MTTQKKDIDMAVDKAVNTVVRQVYDIIQNRYNYSSDMLNTLTGSTIEDIPAKVKEMREEEAAKIRAVMTEQKNTLELIKVLFPDVQKK